MTEVLPTVQCTGRVWKHTEESHFGRDSEDIELGNMTCPRRKVNIHLFGLPSDDLELSVYQLVYLFPRGCAPGVREGG